MLVSMTDSNQLRISGRIDAGNAAELEKQMLEECLPEMTAQCADKEITIDASGLEYISSAGLRVLLKLKKTADRPVIINNVSSEIFDIFDVTGFANIFDVRKKMREVDASGCEIIGRGGNGTVYKLDDETILKEYHGNTSLEDICKEKEYAKTCFVNGISTAISYDIVRCGENYGIVFEMIKADTVAGTIRKHPEMLDDLAAKMGRLFKQMHETELPNGALPDTAAFLKEKIRQMGKYYTPAEQELLYKLLETAGEKKGIVHGDFHTQNVMLQDGEVVLIDMADVSLGAPLIDLGISYFLFVDGAKSRPWDVERFLGISPEQALRIWDIMLRTYYETDDEAVLKEKEEQIRLFSLFKVALNPAIWPNASAQAVEAFVNTARDRLFPLLEKNY